eukprot:CAMPEP_0115128974 /NCGR_PEP_ID=MMETSP0227-20121206/51492_1 /TAXON_ID=89957 /ORGANISM="Polarella glacialis, Strain CCMP 1383" /LENGTH=67 /DNA_ID=CAMNT_0002533709 /DNA_START=170 /DNA_END=373 /DNA_ORIENTATION=-
MIGGPPATTPTPAGTWLMTLQDSCDSNTGAPCLAIKYWPAFTPRALDGDTDCSFSGSSSSSAPSRSQ